MSEKIKFNNEYYTLEEINKIAKDSISFSEVLKKLGYTGHGGYITKRLHEIFNKYKINYSHFSHYKYKEFDKEYGELEKYLTNKCKITSWKLKNKLIEQGIFKQECSCCQNTEWLGNPIPLELHHKDGNKNNNELKNLELRCPNCHYFTDTYKTKNMKKKDTDNDEKHKKDIINDKCIVKKDKEKYYCKICGKEKSKMSQLCLECYKKEQGKNIPPKEILEELIFKYPILQIANMYGVSDNAVRKWLKKYNLPFKKVDIEKYKLNKNKSDV